MSLKFSILGGSGEIGMNMYLFESDEAVLIVDCGVMFADCDLPGVDLIIPDFTYLENIRNKDFFLLLSHGHEDHIGGVPYLIERFKMPIYGGKLTIKLLESKLKEHKIKSEIIEINENDCLILKDFKIKPIPVNHSISDTFAFHIVNRDLHILHSSDFKIDLSPVNGKPFSMESFIRAKQEGIDLYIGDSTNVINENFTPSESTVKKDLKDIINNHHSRIFFTTFASNIDRIKQLIEVCEVTGRKIVFEGTSIIKNIKIAEELGYVDIPKGLRVPLSEAKHMEDDKICFVISGCQGERQSSLYKIVSKERKALKIKEGDLFIISARVIPGNERNLNNTINMIYMNGGEVVDIQKKHVHVSGHASEEELKLMFNLLQPEYFVPVHGESLHLKKHYNLAVKSNFVDKDNAFILLSGEQLLFAKRKFVEKKSIPSGKTYIDKRGNFLFGEELLKERKHLSRDGVISIIFREIYTSPFYEIIEIKTKGFDLPPQYLHKLKKHIYKFLPVLNEEAKNDKYNIFELFEKMLKTYFKRNFDRRPVISVIKVD
jgi:ribonuclease J